MEPANILSGAGRNLYFDAEGRGLLEAIKDRTDLHVIVVQDLSSNELFIFYDDFEDRTEPKDYLDTEGEKDGTLLDGIKFLSEAEHIVHQNGTGYDFLVFEKTFPEHWSYDYHARSNDPEFMMSKSVDTYVLSSVLDPDRKLPQQAYALGKGNIGSHGLEAHGIRIGRYKPPIDDWSKLTDDILTRCQEDVGIGVDLYYYLKEEYFEQKATPSTWTGMSIQTAYRQEHQLAMSIARQAARGFRFDTVAAVRMLSELDSEMQRIEKAIRPKIPKQIKKKKLSKPINGCTHGSDRATVSSILKKNGEYKKTVTNDYPDCRGFFSDHDNPIVVGPYTPIVWREVPLGNRAYMKPILYKYGWRGVNYSDTEQALIDNGNEEELDPWAGKIDEDSIDLWKKTTPDAPEWGLDMAKWYILNSRRSQICNKKDEDYFKEHSKWPKNNGVVGCRGLLPRAVHSVKGKRAQEWYRIYKEWPTDQDAVWRVPAEALSCATNTFRMRHKVVVNIPKKGLYPLRELFIASPGKKLVICDGAGLELRMLAHFMADPIYQDILLNGEIHSYNQEMAGLDERDTAKTFIYAFLYGSGVRNLASVCGYDTSRMQRVISNFKARLPSLSQLIERLEKVGKQNGYLLAVDGRRGKIRKKQGKLLVHTILNVLLQMTGSITMKYGHVFAERQMQAEKVALDSLGYPEWIEFTHDEFGLEVPEDEVEKVVYRIPSDKWKEEEKKEFIKEGKIYSAPKRAIGDTYVGLKVPGKPDPEFQDVTTVVRSYHRAGHIMAECMTKAGEFLKLRCPIAGEYKIGDNWAECH